jgi:hypothetical protein
MKFFRRKSNKEETTMAEYPHCDSEILHLPKTCVYCDMYPRLQAVRIAARINFTNEEDPTKAPCPAVARRGNSVNFWHGNVAQTIDDVIAQEQYWNDLTKWVSDVGMRPDGED